MRATYRVQLTAAFGFDDARELVPYLRALGVSHLYLSPIMAARPGSNHGYDVVDPTRVSEELGGEASFRRLADTAHAAGLGVIVDFVPNHMATGEENPYWRDERQRAIVFDIDPRTGWQRRFFTIHELAGVRVEDPEVFAETHRTVLALIAEGLIDGLRIDHADGLADPAAYLERLRAHGVARVWVEKILEGGERLRDWPVLGTTGYEFASDVTALFVDPAGEGAMTELYARLTGSRESYAAVRDAAKLEQARREFGPELAKLRSLYPHPGLEEAVASLGVYRTYVQPARGRAAPADREELARLPEDLRRVLTLDERGHDEFVVRFQQTTGPVMAKGVEDTALYRYLRLIALNEVGGDPGRFSLPVAEFHRTNQERAARLPASMLASQTHDTKRSGDVRARIGALPALAEEWGRLVTTWRRVNEPLRRGPGPDADEEYLIYQTLVGAWPIDLERLGPYLQKALREADRNSGWSEPDEVWERSVLEFAGALYRHQPFLETFAPFAERIALAGERAALGALLLRLTCPGVADIYQGDEMWSYNLVDPDNRRPVDWGQRRRALAVLAAGRPPDRHTRKLHLIREALALRERRPHAFAGAYAPLEAPDDVCAFVRGDEVCVIVAVRERADVSAVMPPGGGWREILPPPAGYAPVRMLERGWPAAGQTRGGQR
jgi:(1->4)-alpha-D-glucan 1-alpha-D-glucosylmutase